jgi:hypothetical protein
MDNDLEDVMSGRMPLVVKPNLHLNRKTDSDGQGYDLFATIDQPNREPYV